MKTIVLPFEQWPLVEPVVRGEFDNGMPTNPSADTFITRMDDEKPVAFLHVEMLYHFVSLYVYPEYRNQGHSTGLFLHGLERIPSGFSGIVMEREETPRSLLAQYVNARDLGMRRIWRKDVP